VIGDDVGGRFQYVASAGAFAIAGVK
jgi:hypothetical protein